MKLSIIIPTKNRIEYCLSAIKSILNLKNSNIEIIIQDNSDNSNIELVNSLGNVDNIVYHYHPGILSFVDNFSEAVDIAKGEYLCMIGDDDAIIPNIMEEVNYMVKNNIQCIIPGLNSVYVWPNENPFIKKAENGYLVLSNLKKTRIEVNTYSELVKLLKNGGQNYQSFGIARLYHGIISRKTIEIIKEKTGKVFDGLSPDIYMAVALSLHNFKTILLNYPITISGICPNSGSANSATGKHTGQLENAPHFIGHDNYCWNKKVPKIYSVETIWAETLLHTLDNFGEFDLCNVFSIRKLDMICIGKYPQFKSILKDHAKRNGYNYYILLIESKIQKIFQFIKKVFKKVFRRKNSVRKYYNVKDINEAIEITMQFIKENKNEYFKK